MSERILIRGVNWLGDAVMALPALERLREARPGARITLLTADKLADLFTGHPAFDEILTFSKGESAFALAARLRARFDLAVILPNSFRSAFESFLARIPARAGYAGNGRRFFLTKIVARRPDEGRMYKRSDAEVRALVERQPDRPRDTFPPSAHHLHNYLHLAAALGAKRDPIAPRISVTNAEREKIRKRFAIPDKVAIGLNPGAEYGPAKRWPVENFIRTARIIEAKQPCAWLIFGGAGDQEAAGEIAAGIGSAVINLAGQTSLRELCAGFSLCRAVLTNDTGPMHLAAAVGARVVVPFGSTSPELTGPGLPGSHDHAAILGQAPCAPCFRRTCPIDFRCMLSITPEYMAQTVSAIVTRGFVS